MRGPRHEGKAPANRRGVLACLSARCTLHYTPLATAPQCAPPAIASMPDVPDVPDMPGILGDSHPSTKKSGSVRNGTPIAVLVMQGAYRDADLDCRDQFALVALQEPSERAFIGGPCQLVVRLCLADALPVH